MTCRSARRDMLEAPTAVLRGEGEGDLPAHLRECEACAAIARDLAQSEGRLDQALEALTTGHDVEATLRAVHARVAEAAQPPRRAWAGRWRSVPVLAAAAVVAGLALWASDLVDRPRPPSTTVDASRLITTTQNRRAIPPTGELAVEAQQRFALMKTDKPTISVVWFY